MAHLLRPGPGRDGGFRRAFALLELGAGVAWEEPME